MKKEVCVVGGFVRDDLLNLKSKDFDYVLVGYTTEEIKAMGGINVGKDFEVYLLNPFFKPHQNVNEPHEHAFARTEKSTGDKYTDFETNTDGVTLKEDLGRRDLTINAMARNENWDLIDPYNGKEDLDNKILRHVYDKNNPDKEAFSEDPLRILRVARFAARYSDFSIAPETIELMKKMVKDGMIDGLSSDRVWKELMKVFKEDKPSIFFEVLSEVGALDVLFPELENLRGKHQNPKYHFEGDAFIHTLMVIDKAAEVATLYSLSEEDRSLVIFGALYHDIGKGLVPTELHSLGKHHGHDSLTKVFDLEEEVKEQLNIDERIDNITIPALLKFISKRLGQNSKKYIKFASQSIFSHQVFHNFEQLKDKSKVKFFTSPDKLGLTHKTDRNTIKLLGMVASADNAGRIFLKKDETNSSELIIEDVHYIEVTSALNEYNAKDKVLEIFDAISGIGIKDTDIDLDKIKEVKHETIQSKIYNARIQAVKKINQTTVVKKDVVENKKSKDFVK
jgi:putative nucleotidyltransferase with HDIG domain